ncbi:uncharacterized protein [Euwallacea similis]|uniref:uncharacterized protein n=1 Tax=Euwallacea similis TaxID=1736056 RepID=UPI003450AAC5
MQLLSFLSIFVVLAAVLANNPPFRNNDFEYLISNTKLPYLEAYAACKRYGYTLAIEKSAEDTVKVNEALGKDGDLVDERHFLGGIRENSVVFLNKWMWLEQGEMFNYTNWYPDEELSYDCLSKHAVNSTGYQGEWTTDICTEAHYFICQKNF